jgi:hypothetical protein
MIEQTIIETLIGSFESGEYSQIIGYALLAIAAFVRFMTEGRFTIGVHKWISASSSLVLGVGTALAAGGVWWHALVLGLFAAPTSRGFWELVRGLLPSRPKNATPS